MPSRTVVRILKAPSPETLKGIISLYRAHGWWKPGDKPAQLRRLIAGSYCFAVAEAAGRVIGMGRAISDGVCDAYIQDLAVLKARRGSGTGAALLNALLKRLKRGGVRWVALIAQDNSAYFYRKAGFRALKNAQPMLSKDSYV